MESLGDIENSSLVDGEDNGLTGVIQGKKSEERNWRQGSKLFSF